LNKALGVGGILAIAVGQYSADQDKITLNYHNLWYTSAFDKVFGNHWRVSERHWGVINQDFVDASVGIHIILEIIWRHLSTAMAEVVRLARTPEANPSSIADPLCASKDGRAYSQRRVR
jgi:hypothetical protein